MMSPARGATTGVTPARSIRVAALQVASTTGDVEGNLARAATLLDEAIARGAELVLCPEFLAAGYVYDESLWKAGERHDGPTEAWLRRTAAAHAIHIGATYLEVEGDDFFNTFALAGPGGSILGRVRKESLPAFEGWYFRSCEQAKFIDTALGRVAVGICQDNHTARFYRRVMRDKPDLLLMPHSAPCVPLGRQTMRESLSEIGPYYARAFGIPTIVANKGAVRTTSPVPGIPFVRLAFEFDGMSTITDSDGRVLERLPEREGVIVADVVLDSARKRLAPEPDGFYWSRSPRIFPNALGALFLALERVGKYAYAHSNARVRAARSVSDDARRIVA